MQSAMRRNVQADFENFLLSQRRKARKGFWGKKIIAFDFLGVPGAFAKSIPTPDCATFHQGYDTMKISFNAEAQRRRERKEIYFEAVPLN